MATRNRQTARKTQNKPDNTAEFSIENATERINEIGEEIQSGLSEAGRQASSKFRQLNLNESRIPDTFQNMPKFISPRVHAWLDAFFAGRGRAGAATAAFMNAGMVAGVSALTDYDGSGKKPISFKMHGTLDAMQAATAALAPVLHGFANEAESAFFYGQAANELAVIAGTDWDAGMPTGKRRRKAA